MENIVNKIQNAPNNINNIEEDNETGNLIKKNQKELL